MLLPADCGKSAGCRNHVKQSRLTNHRIDAGPGYFTQQAYALGSGLIHVQGNVRILYESSVGETFFDQGLGFFDGEARQMHVVDQRKVDVAIVAQAAFGGEFGHVVNTYFEQISNAQPGT